MAITSPIDQSPAVEAAEPTPQARWWAAASGFARRRPLGAIGAVVIVIMLAVASVAPLIAPYDPVVVDFGAMLTAPSAKHWLGTDAFGRDVLARLIYGSRTALIVGFGSAFIGATLARSSSR
jgi:peptide/nickel transport system permease protein